MFRKTTKLGYPLYKINRKGVVKRLRSGVWVKLNPARDKDGYRVVNLSNEGRSKQFKLHRLVLLVFVGPCPEGMECRHRNGKPWDNRLGNLRWTTPKRNHKDKLRQGTASKKLTKEKVLEIRKLYDPKKRNGAELGRMYGVSAVNINSIVHRKLWSHV